VSSDDREFDRVNAEGTRNIVEEAHWRRAAFYLRFFRFGRLPGANAVFIVKTEGRGDRQHSGLNYTIIRPTLVYGERAAGVDLFLII